MNLARTRLEQQHLTGPLCARPEDVVEELLAVQSQDFTGAKWAVAQRCEHGDDARVQQAFDAGKILRTHVLRPTWHFVAPADLRWLLALTASRVHAANAYYYRQHALDAATAKSASARIAKALASGEHLTRDELGKKLNAQGNKLALVIMRAELDGLICSGAQRGKQHTYALIEERVPRSRKLEGDEALAELARRYVTGHGPAQAQDLAWWSGLTLAQARRGLEANGKSLHQEQLEGKRYFSGETRTPARRKAPIVHLLPNYDELLIAFKDRSAMLDPRITPKTSVLSAHFVVIDGLIVGGWRRTSSAKVVGVRVQLLRPLSGAERQGLETAAEHFARSSGQRLRLEFAE